MLRHGAGDYRRTLAPCRSVRIVARTTPTPRGSASPAALPSHLLLPLSRNASSSRSSSRTSSARRRRPSRWIRRTFEPGWRRTTPASDPSSKPSGARSRSSSATRRRALRCSRRARGRSRARRQGGFAMFGDDDLNATQARPRCAPRVRRDRVGASCEEARETVLPSSPTTAEWPGFLGTGQRRVHGESGHGVASSQRSDTDTRSNFCRNGAVLSLRHNQPSSAAAQSRGGVDPGGSLRCTKSSHSHSRAPAPLWSRSALPRHCAPRARRSRRRPRKAIPARLSSSSARSSGRSTSIAMKSGAGSAPWGIRSPGSCPMRPRR